MFRTFAVAAILSLTVAARADDSLTARVHEAAVKACAAKVGDSLPILYYSALRAHCVDRVSAMALASIHTRQMARTEAPAAAN